MPNIFDQFDEQPVRPAKPFNIFDQFDEPQRADPYAGLGIDPPKAAAPADPYAGLGIVDTRAPRPATASQRQPVREPGPLERNLPSVVYENLPDVRKILWDDTARVVGPLYDEWFGRSPSRPAMPHDGQIIEQLRRADRKPSIPTEGMPGTDMSRERSRPLEDRIADYRAHVEEQQRRWDEEKAFQGTRTLPRRVADTAVFVAGLPIRAVTQGQYGLSDINPVTGDETRAQEESFNRANEAGLYAMKRVGDASLGEFGAVKTQTQRAAFRQVVRENEAQLAREGVTPSPATSQASQNVQAVQDFRDAGVTPYTPAVSPGPLATISRSVEDIPGVGRIVTGEKAATERSFIERQRALARDLSTPEIPGAAAETQAARPMRNPLSADQAGSVIQDGLERYRTARLQDLDPEALAHPDLQINPHRPEARRSRNINVPDSEEFNTSGYTPRQMEAGATGRINLPEHNRATVEHLSDAEIGRIIAAPDNLTSFVVKQDALFERARRNLVPIMRELSERQRQAEIETGQPQGTVNAMLVPTRQTAAAITELQRHEAVNNIPSGLFQDRRFGELFHALAHPQRNFTLERIRSAKTAIGRELAAQRGPAGKLAAESPTLSINALEAIYGALSRDEDIGLMTYAFRARNLANEGRLHPELADRAALGWRDFKRADKYTKEAHGNFEAFHKLYDAPTVEAAARKIAQALKEKTQDAAALESVFRALRPEEGRVVMGHVFNELGMDASHNFSFERFGKEFRSFSGSPRIMGVLRRQFGEDHLQSLGQLARIADVIENYNNRGAYRRGLYAAAGAVTAHAALNPATAIPTLAALAATGAAGAALTSQTFLNKVLLPSYRLRSRIDGPVGSIARNASELRRVLPPHAMGALMSQQGRYGRTPQANSSE